MAEENEPRPVFGAVCYRKQRRKRQKMLLIELFMDFAKNTTLHGLRYITERGLTLLEKIFWFVTFVISVAMCFVLIRNVYTKWKTSPVIVSFSEQIVPVGMVPFPSMTICPEIKSKQTVYNYTEKYTEYFKYINGDTRNDTGNSSSMESLLKLEDVGLICSQEFSVDSNRNVSNASLVETIVEVSPTIDEVFEGCEWRGQEISCSQIFQKVLSSNGVCYNFNALAADEIFQEENIQKEYTYLDTSEPSRDWSVVKGYINDNPTPYPRRGRENGATSDLAVILKEDSRHRDDMCNSLNEGFKIFVQHPADLPHDSLYYYAALPDQVSSLALKFSMLTTSDSLRDYTPQVRQCYFPDDRKLRYFRTYTQNNCRLECESIYTFRKCGCVWYNMPHHDSRSICTIHKKSCVMEAKENLATKEMKADLGSKSRACRCLPACDSVQYDAEILKTKFDVTRYLKSISGLLNDSFSYYDTIKFSKIELYFKEPRFVSMRRSELFGLTDFLANCGGLLGLFLGFSFLSLVEIIYFLTLRLCCTLRRDLKEERAERRRRSE